MTDDDRLLARSCQESVGPGRWAPRGGLGTFPIRFPSAAPPGDDGWHLDASFQGDADPGDYFSYRVNVASKGRALLMPFLFSETDENDAPTRIRVGSHLDVAPLLAPYGEYGLTMVEISTRAIPATEHCSIAFATGRPGDVYLCHPLLVHAAQPPLDPVEPYDVDHGTSPVEQARAMSPGAG